MEIYDIKNQNLSYIGRTENRAIIGFGDIDNQCKKHIQNVMSKYYLYIYCPFRILDKKGNIIAVSRDIYINRNEDIDTVNLEEQNITKFDECIDLNKKNLVGKTVKSVSMNRRDITIYLEEYKIETFNNFYDDIEAWRMFESLTNNGDIVVFGC